MTTLAWTLAHFVWQGTVIAAVAALVLRCVARTSAVRYIVAVAALAAMLVAPIATYGLMSRQARSAAVDAARSTGTVSAQVESHGPAAARGPQSATNSPLPEEASSLAAARGPQVVFAPLPAVVVTLWALGVLGFAVRLIGGWVTAMRFVRRRTVPAREAFVTAAGRVAALIGVTGRIRVRESAAVESALVIGCLRPIVVLPVAALGCLPAAQVEAVIAHELAHVLRRDYAVNMLQMAVETVLFYHPAVWWLSGVVRAEREHCCDDLAVTVCDRVQYVTALSRLAELQSQPRLALAAVDGSLVERARRLLAAPPRTNVRSEWLRVAVPGGALVCLPALLAAAAVAAAAPASGPAPALVRPTSAQVSSEARETQTIENTVANKRVHTQPATPAVRDNRNAPSVPATDVAQVATADESRVPAGYVIGPDDVLSVMFWREAALSNPEAIVRPDGKITVPLIGDVQAAGLSPAQLSKDISAGVAKYVQDPVVTVSVKAINSRVVYISGLVQKPGIYRLTGSMTVLQLISAAGGLTGPADLNEIKIHRIEGGTQKILRFNYNEVLNGTRVDQNLELRPGDTVIALPEDADAVMQREAEQRARARRADAVAEDRSLRAATNTDALEVLITHPDGSAVGFTPRAEAYSSGGPGGQFNVPDSDHAHTSDGRPISRIGFRGWREGDAVRVTILGFAARPGDAANYTAVPLASRLIRVGQSVSLDELTPLGLKPLTITLRQN